MKKGMAALAMMMALSEGMKFDNDSYCPRRGGDVSRPSTLTEKEKKERKRKNKARKSANKKNRKH